jgi:alpha-tubulin suppressor-like RCC1 family protein
MRTLAGTTSKGFAAAAVGSVLTAATLLGGAGAGATTPPAARPDAAALPGQSVYATGNGLSLTWQKISSAAGVTAIDAENGWSMELVDHQVYAWGQNRHGELGNGTFKASLSTPVKVDVPADIVQVDGGKDFGLAVTEFGTVYSWGYGGAQLGTGNSTADRPTPQQIPGLNNVVRVSAGNQLSLALLRNGTVTSWGANIDGDLGQGSSIATTATSSTPTAIPGLSGVVAVSAGCNWGMALLRNGTVMAWGDNRSGQLGDGSTAASAMPVAVHGLTGAVEVSAGGDYDNNGAALALDSQGNVWAWGDNKQGQLGVQTVAERSNVPLEVSALAGQHITSVSSGGLASAAMSSSGNLWVWGSGIYGQLGNGSTGVVTTPALTSLKGVTTMWAGAESTIAVAD